MRLSPDHSAQAAKPRSGSFSRRRIAIGAICPILFLLAVLCFSNVSRAADTYGTMLDKRLEGPPKTTVTNEATTVTSGNAAELEREIKKRAAQVELGPPPPPPAN